MGDQWGSPTYAPDLAAVILEIVRQNADAYGESFENLTFLSFPRRRESISS